MATDEISQVTFTTPLECRYLLHTPTEAGAETPALVALHGYGANPKDILTFAKNVAGPAFLVASIQAPNQHYLADGPPGPESRIGYNWGVRDHWRAAVELHHAMVLQVLASLQTRFGTPSKRTILFGFSQPVGLNYRFAGTHPGAVGGVIGICGGIPRDWEEGAYGHVTASLLHISRDEDEFYPVSVVAGFAERLRRRADDVEFHLIPGAHRFPSKGRTIVRPWLERVLGK